MSQQARRLLFDFPKQPEKAKLKLIVKEIVVFDWQELSAMAQADESCPKLTCILDYIPNPNYDPDYVPPKDEIPF